MKNSLIFAIALIVNLSCIAHVEQNNFNSKNIEFRNGDVSFYASIGGNRIERIVNCFHSFNSKIDFNCVIPVFADECMYANSEMMPFIRPSINDFDSAFALHLTKNFDAGQLCNWQYYRKITVNNSANSDTLIDYTVLLYVNTAQLITDGKVNADGSDIRFTTNFIDDLEYWIEPGIQNEHGMNDDSTHIWVKVPVIPALSNTTLYMFYGNPTASAKSNISTTFLFGDDFDDNSADLTKWDFFTSNSGQIIEQNQRIEHNSPASMPESSSAIFSKQAFTGPVVVEMQFKKGGYVYRGAGMMDDYNVNQNSAWIGWQDWGAFGPGVTIASVSQGVPFRNDTWSRQYNPEYYLSIYRKPDSTYKFIGHIPPFEDNGYKYWTHTFTTAKMPLDVPLKVGATEYVWVSAWPLWTRYEDNIRVRKYSEPEPICSIITELETNIPDSIFFDTICSNDSLLWRSQYYSTAGTYYDSLTSQLGCDSVFVLELYVHPAPVVNVNNDTICLGENATLLASGATTYEWNTGSTDNPYLISPVTTTIYTVTGTDGNMCSNTAQATVVVNDLPIDLPDMKPTKVMEITADANTIVLDHLNNSSSGNVHGALTFVESVCGLNYAGNFDDGEWIHYGYNANLRDAATVDMWIFPTAYSTPLVDFNWSNTVSYPGSGHVFHLDLNAAGHITMSNWPGTGLGFLEGNSEVPLNEWTHVTVSWGDSTVMYLNGNVDTASAGSFRPSASGPYHIYVPKWGSVNDLLIDEFHVSNKRRSQTEIRQGYQYLSIYADDDSICANTSTNIVIANPQSDISYQLIKEGVPYGGAQVGDCLNLIFNTGNLSATTQFTVAATNTITGCGIILDTIISIIVHPEYEFPTFAETCDNQTYMWRGTPYDVTGVYYDSLVSQYGCDSVYVLNLTVHPTYEFVTNGEICDNQIYTWRSNSYSIAGTYYDSLITSNGCDSVYVLNLIVHPTYESVTTAQICDNETYLWRTNTYSVAGTYYDSLTSIYGCDSVFVLNLSVNPTYEFNEHMDLCWGDNIWWHGNNYNDEGVYYDSLTTLHGCDSVYILTITRHFPYLFEDMITVCQGDTFTWQDSTYTEEGILAYGAYYTSVYGCDSTYILYVNALPIYEFTQDEEICSRDSLYWRGDWYKFAGTYYDSLQTQSGCDSVYVLNLEVLPTYEFNSYDTICEGDSYFWRGNYYTSDGEYFDSLITIMGCDSTYSLTLTVLDLPLVSISGIDVFYCDYDASVTMVGTPPGGTFSGQGVSGNVFDPAAAGLGTWPVSYLYADPFGCTGSDTIYVEVDECAGIDESGGINMAVFPNPTDGKFTIKFGRELHQVEILITDITGKLIYNKQIGTTTVFEGVLISEPTGMYFVEIISQEGRFVLKLMKD